MQGPQEQCNLSFCLSVSTSSTPSLPPVTNPAHTSDISRTNHLARRRPYILTGCQPEGPFWKDIGDSGEGDAEGEKQEVCHGQVDEEQVGDGFHGAMTYDDVNNQAVSENPR